MSTVSKSGVGAAVLGSEVGWMGKPVGTADVGKRVGFLVGFRVEGVAVGLNDGFTLGLHEGISVELVG